MFRFGRRLFSCPPLKQSKCNFKKIGLGVALGLTCTFIGLKMKDRSIIPKLSDNPDLLKNMWFPSKENCTQAIESSNNVIIHVPWYHREEFIVQHPESLNFFVHDNYGVFDASRKLIEKDENYFYSCHNENLVKLFDNISNKFDFVNYGNEKFTNFILNDIDNKNDLLKHSLSEMSHARTKKLVEDLTRKNFDFKKNMDLTKSLINYRAGDIVLFPESMMNDILPLVPKERFKDPNKFVGLVLTGKQFNEYFAPVMDYYKVTDVSENHNGLQFHDGLVEDIKPFDKNTDCDYGIYFSHVPDNWTRLYNCSSRMCHLRRVTLPNDAIVKIELNKVKANKVILGSVLTDSFDLKYNFSKHNLR
jgi:hypothetical protein